MWLVQEEEERLNEEFVSEAHFGGFMTKKDDEYKEGRGNTRKDFIENLIKVFHGRRHNFISTIKKQKKSRMILMKFFL